MSRMDNMNFDLTGTLFMTDNNGQSTLLSTGSISDFDMPLSATEMQPMYCHLNNSAQFTSSIDYANMSFFNALTYPVDPYNFTLVYYIPIMIQARWHKKARVNKKWQKRYGMKEDSVRVEADAKTIGYNSDDYSFDIPTDGFKRILRPDQQRRGIKIEW